MIEDKVKVIMKENVPDKIKTNKNIENMNNKLKDKVENKNLE